MYKSVKYTTTNPVDNFLGNKKKNNELVAVALRQSLCRISKYSTNNHSAALKLLLLGTLCAFKISDLHFSLFCKADYPLNTLKSCNPFIIKIFFLLLKKNFNGINKYFPNCSKIFFLVISHK